MALRDGILDPISESSPCGAPAESDPKFEKLREARRPNEAAIETFLSPRDSGAPRVMTRDIWMPRELAKVIDMSGEILATKSKDLGVAAWLTEALLWRDGFAGLREGLQLIRDLLERYWDTLHPLPDEGDYYMRIRHLEWLGMTESVKESSPNLALGFVPLTQNGITWNQYKESREIPYEREASGNNAQKRNEAVREGKTPPEDVDAGFDATPKSFYKKAHADAKACLELTTALDELCREKFAGDPPGFTRLRGNLEAAENAVRILLARKLEKDPDPPEPVAVPEGTPEGAPAVTASEPAIPALAFEEMMAGAEGLSGAVPANRQEAIIRIAAAAHYLRAKDPSHPASYLILRGLRWGEIYAAADVNPAMLAAPPSEVRVRLRDLAARGRWAEALETAEQAMAAECGRGWLDLQRYAIRACEELGYREASRAMLSALRKFLADFPALPNMTLLDDTGTANPDTLAWLAQGGG